MTARLTKTQRAALTKLIDGEWHRLSSFHASTLTSLRWRGLIERSGRTGFGPGGYDFRLTDAGRAALGATP